MNEQLQTELTTTLSNELINIVSTIRTGTETAVGFVAEQTPDVVRQLLLWHTFKSVGLSILFLGVSIFLFYVFTRTYKAAKIHEDNLLSDYIERSKSGNLREFESKPNTSDDFVCPTVCFVFSILFLLISSFCVFKFIKLTIAPKAWLLTYISDMMI